MIYLDVDGVPIPWARPGIMRMKNCNVVYDKQKKQKEMYQWQINAQYKEPPLTMPLMIDLTFRMPIPKSTSAPMRREMLNGVVHHSKKPDIDNLTKFILDCMNTYVFIDDSQIAELRVRKMYSNTPGTLIRIRPFTTSNRQELEKEIDDEHYSRDPGSGDIFRDCPDKERTSSTGRKENRVIPF